MVRDPYNMYNVLTLMFPYTYNDCDILTVPGAPSTTPITEWNKNHILLYAIHSQRISTININAYNTLFRCLLVPYSFVCSIFARNMDS